MIDLLIMHKNRSDEIKTCQKRLFRVQNESLGMDVIKRVFLDAHECLVSVSGG